MCWNREQENGIMTVLVFQDLTLKARDIQAIFHCFETQNSLTHFDEVNELTEEERFITKHVYILIVDV